MIDIAAIRRNHPLPAIVSRHVRLVHAGKEWKGLCPFHQERSPSFTIFAGGERFHCFGCDASGDVLDFIRAAEGCTLSEAAERLAGNGKVEINQRKSNRQDACKGLSGTDIAARIERARSIWRQAIPVLGTLAEVYLASRALNLIKSDILRFSYLPCGGTEKPALVAPVLSRAGALIGIQRTFLAPDGRGKAEMPKPKLSLGRIAGGAIQCAQPVNVLIVTEGLEDALSAMQIFGMPAWAAAGGGMMAKINLPDHVRSVVIGADNDEAGYRAATKAAAAFCGQGRQVRIVRPADRFKDFNAELMGVHNG